jgi:hypothetical protein
VWDSEVRWLTDIVLPVCPCVERYEPGPSLVYCSEDTYRALDTMTAISSDDDTSGTNSSYAKVDCGNKQTDGTTTSMSGPIGQRIGQCH